MNPRRLVVLAMVFSSVVLADKPKPRVMVILDTSKSMLEPTNADSPLYQMSVAGGDWDPVANPVCLNKFCTAKKVIYDVIPTYTTEARIGLATYYQFVLTNTRPDTQSSTCRYDVLAPIGQLRTFSSDIDLTGGGDGSTATTFPDGNGNGTGLDQRCNTPAGYSRNTATFPVKGTACAGKDCYLITKTATNPAGTLACTVNTDPGLLGLPKTFAGTQCPALPTPATTASFTAITMQDILPPPASVPQYFRKFVATGSTTCAGSPSAVVTNPVVAAAHSFTANPTIGTAVNQWTANTGTLTCRTGAPCDLYLVSSSTTSNNTPRAWYGFFNGSFVPNPAITTPLATPTYPLSAGSVGVPYSTPVLTGTRSVPTATACIPSAPATPVGGTALLNAGEALGGQLNIPVGAMPPAYALGGRANETPTYTGADYTCSAGWPCHVTLVSDTPNPVTYTPGRYVYELAAITPPERLLSGPTNETFTLRITNAAAQPMCPSLNTSSVSPTPPPGAPNTTWINQPTLCGVNGNCTFTLGASGNQLPPLAGTCPATIRKFNNAVVPTSFSGVSPAGTCSWNGKTYSMSGPTAYVATKRYPAATDCPGPNVSLSSWAGYTGTATTAGGTINASNQAALTLSTDVATTETTNNYNVAAVPGGYSLPVTMTTNDGAVVQPANPAAGAPSDPTGGCLGAAGTQVQVNDSGLCGARGTPCTMTVVGPVEVFPKQCGAAELNKSCYVCRYQPLRFTWSRAVHDCNYSVNRYDFTVDRNAMTCPYTRQRWQVEVPNNPTHTCQVSVGVTRYDFSQPASTWCDYFAVRTTLTTPRTVFDYSYLTKGTEIIGRAESAPLAGDLCSTSWVSGNAFATSCPEQVNDCTGLSPLGASVMPIVPGSTCKLRYGGALANNDATGGGSNNGRYTNYKANLSFDPAGANNRSCESNEPAGTPDGYRDSTASPRGFCQKTGLGAATVRTLISDYYDPGVVNDISLYPTPPGYDPPTWNNTATKEQGFGAVTGLPTVGSGAMTNRSIFVPIPSDAVYDPLTQKNAIEAAVGKCVRPDVTAPGPDGRLAGGACVSDELIRRSSAPSGPAGDVTPLYGSLKNTHQYLFDRWKFDENDAQTQNCRDYFIVLATDGLENTPKNYTVGGVDPATSVQGLVGSFRNLGEPVKTRPDVRTFVIAMGTGAAGEPALNDVANAGGTTQAFQATNLSELQTALNAVFTSITQGVFARSRPALGTDGQRLYAAQYIRPGLLVDGGIAGPDWSGVLTAYKVSQIDGTFQLAWEHGTKLNNPSHPARLIYAGLRKKSDGTKEVGTFTTAFAELVDQLNDQFDASVIAAGLTSADVISFLRGRGDTYLGSPGTRSSALGPISHSAPIVVAKTPYDTDWGGTSNAEKAAFTTFRAFADTRPPRVMVSANDGMIHAIREGDTSAPCTGVAPGEADMSCVNGYEAWSYVPGSLVGRMTLGIQPTLVESLHKLKQGNWSNAYLNNSLSVADICDNGSGEANGCTAGQWKTIAIATQREGGRGVAAIDITNGSAPSTTSRFLWDYSDSHLGLTYSAPAVGRIVDGSDEVFAAIFGGGDDDPDTGSFEGRRVFVLNAATGQEIRTFSRFDRGSSLDIDLFAPVLMRPAIYRRPGPYFSYLNSAFVGAGETMYALRFAKPDGSPQDDSGRWKPDELFDPTSWRNVDRATCGSPPCSAVVVNDVIIDPSAPPADPLATPPVPPTYKLERIGAGGAGELPLGPSNPAHPFAPVPPPLFNRPRLSAQLIPSGAQADLYYGTGDVRDPDSPGNLFQNGNFFYAVHDFNNQPRGPVNDGRALWVVRFPLQTVPNDRYEQVVSEPAIISGCVIVITYTTAAAGPSCDVAGDTTLYGFHPVSGELQKCLTYLAPSPYAGQSTSVLKLTGVGIPSDPVVINDNLYLQTSHGGLTRTPVRVPPKPGAVRSYRRIK